MASCTCDPGPEGQHQWYCQVVWYRTNLTPSADLPACRDELPAWQSGLAAAYPDPPEYPHPEDDDVRIIPMVPVDEAEDDWG